MLKKRPMRGAGCKRVATTHVGRCMAVEPRKDGTGFILGRSYDHRAGRGVQRCSNDRHDLVSVSCHLGPARWQPQYCDNELQYEQVNAKLIVT